MTAPMRHTVLAFFPAARARAAIVGALGLVFAMAAVLPVSATEVQRVVSPGGIEAWLVSEDAVPLIAMDFAFRGGSSQEPADKAGLATLTAALFDEGAGDLDDDAFKRRLEAAAVRMSFNASRDTVQGSLSTLTNRREEAFGLLALALAEPRFDAEPLQRIRSQLIVRQRSRENDPDTIASRRFSAETFPGHPYGTPTDGTPETLAAIEREDVAAFHARTFARDNLVVGVVGAITAEDLGPLLDQAFGALPETAGLDPVADVEPRLGLTVAETVTEPQTVIRVATRGIARAHPDFMAAYVMNHILGGGTFSSRLYREIREARGLAYSVSSALVTYDHANLTIAATATNPASADEVLDLLRSQFARMAEEGPSKAELADAKRYLTGNYALRFDTSSRIAGQLVGLQLEGMPIDYFDIRNDLVEAVTLEDVRRVARELLSGPMTVLTVGPSSS